MFSANKRWVYLSIYLCLLIVVMLAAPGLMQKRDPPLWGGVPTYSVMVNFTNPRPVSRWTFAYFHDDELGAERYEHYPPQFDEMCVDLPYGSQYQCNVIFATNGWSYLQFPQADFCCKCESQFGAIRGDWLKKNSTFVGIETINQQKCEHWTKQGQYLNHYYCTSDDKRLPVVFNELWGQPPTLKQWDFKLETFNPKKFDRKLIDPPANCENYCMSGPCQAYRNVKRS